MIESFVVAFGLVFLAELGDKSQLLALALATRYPALVVLAAIGIAALVMEGAAVLLGAAFALALPSDAIEIAAGLAFFAFALWSLREAAEEEHAAESERLPRARGWTVLALAGAFIVAELGDKTQLVTLTLAATREPIGTWLGASAGMFAVSVLAVAVGAALGSRLPRRAITLVSAAAFALFGVLLIAGGLGLL